MRMLNIVLNWIKRQIMSFIRFALEDKLNKEKKEAVNAVEEANDAYNDFQSELTSYEFGETEEVQRVIEEVRGSSGETEESD